MNTAGFAPSDNNFGQLCFAILGAYHPLQVVDTIRILCGERS